MVFDDNLDVHQKSRFVVGGQMIKASASLFLRESVYIAFLLAALNTLAIGIVNSRWKWVFDVFKYSTTFSLGTIYDCCWIQAMCC
jgi:hypothetical protein